MSRTRVKICGIGRPEDALAAAHAGADAIGMVFVDSAPRNVSLDRAAEILAILPAFVTPVGLFVDSSTSRIIDIAKKLRLRHLQLHGHESPEQIAELRDFIIVKAIRADRDRLSSDLKSWRDAIAKHDLTNLRGLLIETAGTDQPGGTGIENDWSAIRAARDAGHFDNLPSLIAAGGLTLTNVATVVKSLRPWAVDVSSGVEASKGIKLPEKIEAFIAAVRRAD